MAKRKVKGPWSKRARAEQTRRVKGRRDRQRAKRRAEGPGPIEIRTRTQWRNKRTGTLVPFTKRKGAARELILEQVDAKGRVLRSIGYSTKDEVLRTVVKGMIAESGPDAGLIAPALERTNIMSPSSLKGARRMVVKVAGTGPDGGRQRFQFDIDRHTISKRRKVLKSVLLSMILSEMRLRSWRTWYRIAQVDWTKARRGVTAARAMVPMRDVEISVRVSR